jgi:outer membrane protein assembly factor BamB
MINKTYQVDPNVIWKDVDGIIYILQPEREEIHALNETGTFIWRLINKGYSLAQVKKELLSQYNVTSDRVTKDIQEFIDRYIREKFITPKCRNPKKGK